jgi:hypothetical protein
LSGIEVQVDGVDELTERGGRRAVDGDGTVARLRARIGGCAAMLCTTIVYCWRSSSASANERQQTVTTELGDGQKNDRTSACAT